jgi:hypothetical protein
MAKIKLPKTVTFQGYKCTKVEEVGFSKDGEGFNYRTWRYPGPDVIEAAHERWRESGASDLPTVIMFHYTESFGENRWSAHLSMSAGIFTFTTGSRVEVVVRGSSLSAVKRNLTESLNELYQKLGTEFPD